MACGAMDERRAVNMRATFGFSSHWTSTTTGSDLRASATRRWRCVAAAATRSTQARWSRCHQRRQCRGAHARAWRPLPPPPPWPQRAGRRGPHGRRNETTKGLERRDLLCFRLRAKAVEELGPALSAARFCRVPISILGCASKLPRVWHDTHRRCAAIGFPPIWCAIAVGALFPPPERSTRGAGFERCAGFSFFS